MSSNRRAFLAGLVGAAALPAALELDPAPVDEFHPIAFVFEWRLLSMRVCGLRLVLEYEFHPIAFVFEWPKIGETVHVRVPPRFVTAARP